MHVSFPSEDDMFLPVMMGPPTLVAAMKPRPYKEMDDAIELYQDEVNILELPNGNGNEPFCLSVVSH